MCDTLYVSDLDGTLLNRQDRVSEFSVKVINSLLEQGMRFTYATARSYSSAKKVAAGLRISLPVIVYNGAFLLDPKTGKPLLEQGFSPEQKGFVGNLLAGLGLSPLVYAFVDGAERVSWRPDRENEGVSYYIGNRKGDKRLRPVSDDESLYRGNAFYFTCVGTREQLSPLWERIKDAEEYTCTFQQELYRTEYWLEIMPRKATKAHAVRELKRLLGCERLVVFGDAVNDLPLFAAAEESYAVENAVPELKAAATAVIGTNEGDGVARWLLEHAVLPADRLSEKPAFHLRRYESRDLEELITLFYETVHTVNLRDYTQEEADAWVPSPESVDREAWDRSLSAHFTLVAEAEGRLVGFGDMDAAGYFDRLYVHKDFQGRGAAAALAEALEARAWEEGAERITVHASLTARPFFEKRGYRVKKEQRVSRNHPVLGHAVSITNFVMEKERGQGCR